MNIPETVYLHYLSALVDGDKETCRLIISKLLTEKHEAKSIYDNIIKKSMYRIGQLWEKCRLSVAEEHVASEITKEILSLINISTENKCKTGKSIVITCVQKEYHEIGPKLISDFFELKGWCSTFVGSNIPPKDFIKLLKEKKPDLVGISNNFYLNITRLLELVDLIKQQTPEQQIIIGGQGPNNCYLEMIDKYPDVHYLKTLDDIENFIVEKFPT
ncbi:MAG: cobalamin-dependent protein [Bacteroidetes bacterium]|nr:cobalamin-dependent protein [Bacteroidota bacterium]